MAELDHSARSARYPLVVRLVLGGLGGFVVLLFVLGSLRLLFFRGPARTPEPLPVRGLVDIHAHVAGIGAGDSGCFVSETMAKSYKYPIYLWALGVSEGEVMERGDRVAVERLAEYVRASKHVDLAVLLAMDGIIVDGQLDRENTQVYIPNEFVARETARFDELAFGASINPYRPDALDLLRKAREQGAVLVKWIPSIMHIDPADPAIEAFYRELVSLGIPLLTHTGMERSFLGARDDLCDPRRLALPLGLGVTVIAAHIATTGTTEGQENMERLIPMLNRYSNLYADISSLTQINKIGYLQEALRNESIQSRLVFGSDWPLQFTPLVSPFYQCLDLDLQTMLHLQFLGNPFDRDVELKQALGVPAAVFDRSRKILFGVHGESGT